MDPKLLYWTGALLNMLVMMAFVFAGVRQVRRGDVARHRVSMAIASAQVAGFVLSYVGKVAWLGREDFSLWSTTSVWTLRVHETCVLVMILAGAFAGAQAFRMRKLRNVTRNANDPLAPKAIPRWHRRGGWVAVYAAALGAFTAIFVWAGMVGRAQ
jgi:uncharacterized membrane protein YozB (DUF420 family)